VAEPAKLKLSQHLFTSGEPMNPEDLLYTRQHEWIRIDGDAGTVGITDHAQRELGDVVFLELPKVGDKVAAGKSLGTIESVKAVSEIFCPVTGEITEVNTALVDAPETVNADPYGKGWLVRLRIEGSREGLLTAKQYEEYVGS
jgi:glycine cleavage system H protein